MRLLGLVRQSQSLIEHAEFGRRRQGFRVVRFGPTEQIRRPFEVLPRIVISAEGDVGVGDGPAHRRLDIGLGREFIALGDPSGRLVEDIGHRHLVALGLGRVHR